MVKQDAQIVINRLDSVTQIFGMPILETGAKFSKWYKLYVCFLLLLLTYLFQWCLQIKFAHKLYDIEEALLYALLEITIHVIVYLGNIITIVDATFHKVNVLKQVVHQIRKIDEFLKNHSEQSKKSLKYLYGEAACVVIYLTLQYGLTTAVYYIYLDFYVIESYISYNLNVVLLLTMCLTLHTFIELLKKRIEDLNIQLQKTLFNSFKAGSSSVNVIYLNIPCNDVHQYCKYYKMVFKVVELLNNLYGIQMLFISFLNLMAIIYNMYVSTMNKTTFTSYPEMYLLLIHILHSVIYLVSKKRTSLAWPFEKADS